MVNDSKDGLQEGRESRSVESVRPNAIENRAVRTRLEALIRESGEGYAAISRLLGRNPAYIQQFIKRGIPRRLSEIDRRLIAGHFGISEAQLGAPDGTPAAMPARLAPDDGQIAAHATIPYLASHVVQGDSLVIDRQFLRPAIAGRTPARAAHAVAGDSMAPTLLDGDQVLVDTADNLALRDGLYVIESDGVLLCKRLSVNPVTRRLAILSDNAAYPSFPDCDPGGIRIVGRIVWVGRRLA